MFGDLALTLEMSAEEQPERIVGPTWCIAEVITGRDTGVGLDTSRLPLHMQRRMAENELTGMAPFFEVMEPCNRGSKRKETNEAQQEGGKRERDEDVMEE